MKYQNKETKIVISYDGKLTSSDAWSGLPYQVSEHLGRSKKTGKLLFKKEKFHSASEAKQFIALFLNCDVSEINDYKFKP